MRGSQPWIPKTRAESSSRLRSLRFAKEVSELEANEGIAALFSKGRI
jgi:hypothetical protein